VGDIANMTDNDGRVNGHRLLRWLRSRAQMEHEAAERGVRMDNDFVADTSIARRNLLMDMADDLERELTPPDYPEDDGDGVDLDDPALRGGPEEERQS
jgi:hypothetical protein